mgnify:CR=1 FL=1
MERRVGAIRQRSEPVDEEGAGDKEEVEENEVEEEEETAGEEAGDEDEERGDGSYQCWRLRNHCHDVCAG